ncbi:hypothetical protein BOTBODRAFT_496506 [Botryobasidium botryosum FD-172 SS1]|uniref:C2H2-type domain-containing protein n=1 Tax=Botryobasidium botryosum (strain FD-172 SS1) TaxID=930990 RepID=A0A067M3U4_BOTB1|nr:hypothetical protein BOTBODRAFT_496506 [Botryobasidium botryosum FD-172 SS1]
MSYLCSYNGCALVVSSQGHLIRHMDTHNQEQGMYSCQYCSYTARQRSNVKVHIQTVQ